MSNKTQNAEKAKTKSAHNTFFALLFILFSFGFLAVSTQMAINKFDESCNPHTAKPRKLRCDIRLDYATTAKQHEQGLSGRDHMADDVGMLFIFDEPERRCMWMKNMRFNLDILWLSEDMKIIRIEKNVSLATYPKSFCARDSKYVIELKPGTVDKLGFDIGDSIQL